MIGYFPKPMALSSSKAEAGAWVQLHGATEDSGHRIQPDPSSSHSSAIPWRLQARAHPPIFYKGPICLSFRVGVVFK